MRLWRRWRNGREGDANNTSPCIKRSDSNVLPMWNELNSRGTPDADSPVPAIHRFSTEKQPMINKNTLTRWAFMMLALLLTACGTGVSTTPSLSVTATLLLPTPTVSPVRPSPTVMQTSPSATPVSSTPVPSTSTPTPERIRDASNQQTSVFEEHFDTNKNGWETGRTSNSAGTCDSQVVEGKFRMTAHPVSDYDWCSTIVPGNTIRDGTLSVNVTVVKRLVGGLNASLSISLRDRGAGRYDFYFYGDGSYTAYVSKSDNYTTTQPYAQSDFFRLDPGVTNAFSITASGAQFAVYANGHLLYTQVDDTLMPAGFMSWKIGAGDIGQDFTVDFDDVVIQASPDVVAQIPATPVDATPASKSVAATTPPKFVAATATAEPHAVTATPVSLPATAMPVPVVDTATPAPVQAISDEYILYFHFGAQGCPYSRRTAPTVERFYQAHNGRVKVVGMPVPGWGNDVQDFRNATGITFPVVANDSSVDESRIPVLVLVNTRTGTRQVLSQGVISYVDLESQVNGVIGGHSVAVQSGSS